MAKTYNLAATKRETSKHSARDARDQKQIPGVVYGHGFDPQSVAVDYSEFLRTYRKAGQAALIDLDIDGKMTKVVIQSYDLHPVQDTFRHIDFFAVNLKEAMIVHVPLLFVGESPAIKNLGAMFNKLHDTIDIRCLPADIPHDIEVDISALIEVGDHLEIKDLNLPEKFELMHYTEDEAICSVSAPRMAEEVETEAPEQTAVESDQAPDEAPAAA